MNWLHYLLEANLYLAVFFAGYYLFLRRETYYTLNRVYLLFSCVASFALPVMQLGALKPIEQPITAVRLSYIRSTVQFLPAHTVITAPVFTWQDAVVYAYVLGAIVFLLILLIKLYQLYKLTRVQNLGSDENYKVVYINQSDTAFSFFNYLFIGTKVREAEIIIKHELVHIRQKHSVDIIFIELLKIVNWFNPFIYLLQYSLREIHEFIADQETATSGADTLAYSSFLVDNAYGLGGSSITHSFFNYNLLKKRIIMLNQKRSGNLARLKYLLAIPICAGLLCTSTLAFSKDYGWVDLDPHAVKPATNINATASNSIGYVIDPSSLSDNTLNTFADKLRRQGYKMLFKKYNDRDNGGNLIEISLRSLYGDPDGRSITGSATFRIAELKKTDQVIFVGADKDRKLVFVHSDTKDLSMQKEIETYHTGPHRIDPANTSLQVAEPVKRLLITKAGVSTVTDKFSAKRADGSTRIYTAYNLSSKDKVDLKKQGMIVNVISDVKIDTGKDHILPPSPPVKRVKFPLPNPMTQHTAKGYYYSEAGYTENGKQDIVVTFKEKDGSHKEFTKSKATSTQLTLLKDKYGYVFPAHLRVPPPPPAPPKPLVQLRLLPPPPAPAKPSVDKRPPPPPSQNPFDTLYRYISKTIRYPKSARLNHIVGREVVRFTIADGKIGNVRMERGLDADIDAEIVRVFKNYNTPVNAKSTDYVLTISFGLEDTNGNMVANSPKLNTINMSAADKSTAYVPLDEVVIIGYVK